VEGIALVSLQNGPAAAQARTWEGRAKLLDLDAEIGTFEDTAAIIDGLDLVVCVDTSVGHLAGVMGKPAWIMLPYAPDWRWLTGRLDTPWYPSLRLFRAPAPKRLDAVVATVAAAIG
jgi:ADP-heptose:LPS heptosyltransferase